jgi:hypothetical protein
LLLQEKVKNTSNLESSEKLYAVKIISKALVKKKPFLQKYIDQEIDIIKKLDHPLSSNKLHLKVTHAYIQRPILSLLYLSIVNKEIYSRIKQKFLVKHSHWNMPSKLWYKL